MNNEYRNTSSTVRIALASFAIVVSVSMLAFVDGLARHYSGSDVQLAAVSVRA